MNLTANIDLSNLQNYHRQFSEQGYLVLNNFLNTDAADQLHECLAEELEWDLAYHVNNTSKVIPNAKTRVMGEKEKQAIYQQSLQQAKDKFGFFYNTFMLVTGHLEGRMPGARVYEFLNFVNSHAFLEPMKTITGCPEIYKADGQATRYLRGHFLKYHDDFHEKHTRHAAYVYSLTKNWSPDMGGLLHLVNDGRVNETLIPTYNQLVLFKVPQSHCVSCIAPFTDAQRFSITGWCRSD